MSATAFQRMRREAAAKAETKAKAEETEKEIDAMEEVETECQDNPDTNEVAEELDLNDMTVEQLVEYAKVNNIDIGGATSQKGILKKIKEAE